MERELNRVFRVRGIHPREPHEYKVYSMKTITVIASLVFSYDSINTEWSNYANGTVKIAFVQ